MVMRPSVALGCLTDVGSQRIWMNKVGMSVVRSIPKTSVPH